ncbi:MAG: cell surface protein SprA [Balneola sp.]
MNIYAQQSPSVIDTSKVVPDSALIGIKFYSPFDKGPVSKFRTRNIPKIYQASSNDFQTVVGWDSVSTYTIQETISGTSVLVPEVIDFETFTAQKKEAQKRELSLLLIQEGKKEELQGRGLLDFSLKIPGGENSAFTTIFGKPEVNLRVNGSANMNVGASIQNIEDPAIPEDQQKRVDPTFNQNLQLNIQGSIGDKLTIATDWDTERAFDYQNRLKIAYTGYEDEIIKSIELGNVSMETGNSLVKGGGSLFGIKSIAELGPLRVTSVLSQQKGESKSQTITGGSQEVQFELQPTDYDDDQHFFLDFYNRQEFEGNMLDNLPLIGTAYNVTELNVWIEDATGSAPSESKQAYAFVDMGVVENPDGTFGLPNQENDRLDDQKLEDRRTDNSVQTDDLNLKGSVQPGSYYVKLKPGEDYEFNSALGIISLKRRVGNNSTLAVSYAYVDPNDPSNIIEVGDLEPRDGAFTYLKLLRPRNLTPDKFAWELTLRNVYSLGVTNVTEEGLTLDFEITKNNQSINRIPGRTPTLLQDLGLDLQDSQQALGSDSRIDFDGLRFNPFTGKIMFPYLEPFGERIDTLVSGLGTDQSELVFDSLYSAKKEIAFESTQNRFYEISGNSKGGVSSSFFLGELVEGSVQVFANGAELIEGVDYEVDYSFGSVTILNDRFLAPGQNLRVEYENNQFFSIGQKNFTGVRAEYLISDEISFGSTFFRLNEQTLSDKIRIGNEPINNTVIGLDANAKFDTPWLTRFIDRIPLLQTKEESNFSISGEFAQLRPGVAQTNAVRDAIDNGILYEDEESGLSFIDDFEGAEFSIRFKFASRWNLPSAPAAVPGYDGIDFENNTMPASDLMSKVARSDLRAQFSWYEIPRNITSILGNVEITPESKPVFVRDVFRGRETNNPQEEVITTLDVYYDPTKRGPYNYNTDLKNKLENEPEDMWGGMTATLPSGQEDLTQNNIEFLEFWVQSVLPGGKTPDAQDINQDYAGKIYIDLGIISEDVIPNEVSNTEDGLAQNTASLEIDAAGRSYIPTLPIPPQGQFSNQNRNLEDVGLDGVPNENGFNSQANEKVLFQNFLSAMEAAYGIGSPEYQEIAADPSNDDYVYYGESRIDGLKLHERFHRVRGYYDGNTPNAGGDKRAVTLKPEKEGLITPSNVEIQNSYFQYEINYNPADFDNLEIGSDSTFIVDKVDGGTQDRTWRLIRIPLNEFTRKIGDINSFQNISYIRMWMSGYKEPFTMRFATLEFVGSQWREAENITESRGSPSEFQVSTVNIEENASRRPIPYRQPEGAIRAVNRGAQSQSLANEQSLVLQTEGLGSQEINLVKRVYPGGLNFLNYSNIRMFVHGEGYEEREDAELVIRMGTDLDNDYYEYRQPVTPSDPDFNFGSYDPQEAGRLNGEAEEVWKYDENSMNIVISAFNVLKQARINDNADPTQLYESSSSEGMTPGSVIAIKGNPSLDRISEFAIGIRNPHDMEDPNSSGIPVLDAEFWVNELRISGFDNENGWAANGKANLKLADFATMNANVTRQTTGFGGLDSRLGQRSVSDDLGYSVSSTVNLHKLVPDRFGWSFPVTVSARRNSSTPKFLPDRGDIRLDDFIEAERNRTDIPPVLIEQNVEEKIKEVQTVTEGYSLNVSNISKSNSQSKLAQYTLDKTKLSYVYNEGLSRNPQLQLQNNWNYSASVNYSLTFARVKLFRPFGFTEDVPGLNLLSGLRIGYMPSSISASTSVSRSYDERRRKLLGDDTIQPIQQTHSFTQRSNFGFSYNLTPSIKTSFRSNTNFDLSNIGIEDLNQTGVDSLRFRVRPTFDVFNDIISSDSVSARRSSYSESYTANWSPKLNEVDALSWLTYNASYGGGFQWNNSPRGSNLGAGISNTFDLTNSFKFDVEEIIDGIGFIQNMRDKDEAESRSRNGANNAVNDTTSSGGINLLGDAQFVGRKLVLALFSMRNIDLNYKKGKSTNQQGYNGQSQLFYAFGDQSQGSYSPPFGYRTGLSEDIDRDQFVRINDNPLSINKTYSDNITLGTSLQLFKNISIDLDWSTRWDERNTETLTFSGANDVNSINISSGDINSSVWGFGNGYEEFFRTQLKTAFEDLDAGVIDDANGNGDGRTVLNRVTLQDDFRNSYLGGNTSGVGNKNFTPIPKPNWRVTWQGFEKLIPIIGESMSRASLTHSYKGTYRLGWQYINQFDDPTTQNLGGITINDNRDKFEPASITIDQRFSPLIQLNVTWKSTLKTDIGYETSKLTSFALSSKTVSERRSKGVKVNLNYTFRRVRIPLFPNITNNIDLALSGNYSEDSDQNFILVNDLINAFQNYNEKGDDVDAYDFDPQNTTGQTRYNGSLIIGYRISSTINSNFEYTYNRVIPKGSSIPPRTNQEIRFNIRIAIRSR